jgi:hypothetical protein
MTNGIEKYLEQLRLALAGSDPATIQDALSDAEEYLRDGVEQLTAAQPDLNHADALAKVIDEFGAPVDIAAAYTQIEARVGPPLAPRKSTVERSLASRFFGVFIDPHAYGALLYMLISMATGIFYFTWVVSGLSLAAGLIILIIGLPFFVLFLLSIRGITLVEGRIVEALLGVRMPRRPLFANKHDGFWARFKALVLDPRPWIAMVYMVLQMPLGILYFTVLIIMIAFGLSGVLMPVIQWGFDIPTVHFGNSSYHMPVWLVPLMAVVGVLWLLLTMHLAKLVGRLHGAFAKAMLVR